MEVIDNIHDNFTLNEDINGPLLAAVIGIEMVVGLITNSFVLILTLCFIKERKKPSNIFLTNMLLINLFIVIFVLPFSLITCATGKWIFGNTVNQKVAVCQFAAYIFAYSFVVTTVSLVLLSFDRFFFIVKAVQYELYMTVNKAVIIVAASWILAAILVSPPLYGLGRYEFASNNGNCIFGTENQVGYAVYFSIVGFSFLSSIVATTTWTYCYVRKHLKRNDRRNYTDSVYISQNRRIIGLFGSLIIIHIFCYSPIFAVAIFGSFLLLPPALYASSFIMLSMIVILSPLAQVYFRPDIRNFAYNFLIKNGIKKLRIKASRQKRKDTTPHKTPITTVKLDESKDTRSPINKQFA